MSWCPKCKNEYVEGIKVCADCGSVLVETLEKQENAEFIDEQEIFKKEILEKQIKREDLPKIAYTGVYENASKKAEDYKSGAYTLLVVGGLGIVFVILFWLQLLPIYVTGTSRYMVTGVMGILFLLFFIMGIFSFKSSKKLEKSAIVENSLTDELTKWCESHFTIENIDEVLDTKDATAELLYFQRSEYMKEIICENFMNLKQDYLDNFVDELYPKIFEEATRI